MSIGANISVIAAGAILSFATHVHTSGFSVVAIGAILMIVGLVSLVVQLASLARQRHLTADEAMLSRPVMVRPGEQSAYRRSLSRGARVNAGGWR
jgi:hypothetical protein